MIAHVLCVEALWLVEGKGPRRREDLKALHDAVEVGLSAPVLKVHAEDSSIAEAVRLMRLMSAEMRAKVVQIVATLAADCETPRKANAAP